MIKHSFFLAILLTTSTTLSPYNFINAPVGSSTEAKEEIDNFLKNLPALPNYAENGYSPLGRSPVVDALLADPLYIPKYAETVSELIKSQSPRNLYEMTTSLFLAAGMPIEQLKPAELLQFSDKVPEPFFKSFSEIPAQKLYGYWKAFVLIRQEIDQTLSVLTKEEKNWLKENYHKFLLGEGAADSDYDFFTTNNPYPLNFFELGSRIDLTKLADSARKLSLISDDFYLNREEFHKISLKEDFIWKEDNLKFIVSQKSHASFEEEADFFIDLGGSNTIHTNAGGADGERSLALHLDLKGGNTYEGRSFVQGSGFLGVGMLFSCSGNNTFKADSYSQGSGFYGVGILTNFEGNNRFNLNMAGQSFALFGSSILWDKEGKNEYFAKRGMAQAFSSTLGVAYLIDNQGYNTYTAGYSEKGEKTPFGGLAQGSSSGVRNYPWLNNPSFYGGLSILYIGGGNNKLKTVWLGQGSSYFLGAGIVIAEGSDDSFEAEADSQGQGLHLAVGLVLKKGDRSRFNGGWGSLGASGDASIGMFINDGDKNHYEATNQSIGSSRKSKSVGIFINRGSGNRYIFNIYSNARLQFPYSPKDWSKAIFIENGKDSIYPENVDEFTRGNDRRWGIENYSVGMSTQNNINDALELFFSSFHPSPQALFSFDPIKGWPSNRSYRPYIYTPEKAQELADEIGTADYDRRRQIYEILDMMRFENRKNEINLAYLLKTPTTTPEDAFNYGVLWALRNKGKADLKEIKLALENGKDFASEYAKKMAVSLIGTYWTPESTPLLARIMMSDKNDEIRYFAALALAINLPENSKDILLEGTKSDLELVRYAIARGLQGNLNISTLEIVKPLFKDKSFYVRRAAGLTAISLGDKSGVSVLLDTLQFNTLDLGDNYGDNVYQQMSDYLGVNFGLDKQAWIDWWAKVKDDYQFPVHKKL